MKRQATRGVICSVVAGACVAVAVAAGGSAAPIHIAVGGPLKVAPPKNPTILSASASPILLPAKGGTVKVTATVRGATSCVITGQRKPFGPYSQSHTVNCRTGHAKATFTVAAATSLSQQTIHFRIRALKARKKTANASTSVVEAPGAPPPPPEAPAISTTDLPEGALNAAYSTQLAATKGKAPYAWSLAGGTLPAGVTLDASGLISGTPTVPGDYVVTLEVSDRNNLNSQATLVLSIDGPALVLTSPINGAHSQNWSGYDVNGGPFTYVSGTFNVPALVPSTSDTIFGEWVGIDGVTSQTVLQAGIGEEFAPGQFSVEQYAWYELYPAAPQPAPLAFKIGDQLTVTISQISGSNWTIRMKNDTTGASWSIPVSYSSALSSAEWIMEAPADSTSGSVLKLGQYSPDITFTKLLVNGPQTTIDDDQMFQAGSPVSTPSSLSPNGFTVHFGGDTPAAP
jgi:hypothetical protein